ncbi:hypothetical protein [Thalassobacillus devorans]|uniref:hypothetical protein n=1 Tax=Thalassobacillus devorans TaxID=279813 RepID=UPI0004B7E989|nr:hypothetical protein [Thalassobacillus devorans]
MRDKTFFNLLGAVTYLSWLLYFLLYYHAYTNSEIVEAVIFISVAMIIYFATTFFYFRK